MNLFILNFLAAVYCIHSIFTRPPLVSCKVFGLSDSPVSLIEGSIRPNTGFRLGEDGGRIKMGHSNY